MSAIGIGELIEKLLIANIKLYMVKEKQAALGKKDFKQAMQLIQDDIELCKTRGALKSEINSILGGQREVKHYGS